MRLLTKPPYKLVGKTKLTIKRRPYPTLVDGIYQPGAETSVLIECNIQPLVKSNGTQFLPEEAYAKRAQIFWTNVPVYQKEDRQRQFQADRFEWEGELYEVVRAINYSMGVLNHWECVAHVVDPE